MRRRSAPTGVSRALIDGTFFMRVEVITLSDSAFRGLLRLAGWCADWDTCGLLSLKEANWLLGSNRRKATRILTELSTPHSDNYRPVLAINGDWCQIDRIILPFGRTNTNWSEAEVYKVLDRDGNTCRYCGRNLSKSEVTIDHVNPRSRGGGDKPRNLVVACGPCNLRKSDSFLDEIGMVLLPEPKRKQVAA